MILKTDIITTTDLHPWPEETIVLSSLRLQTKCHVCVPDHKDYAIEHAITLGRADILQQLYGDLLPLVMAIRRLEFPSHVLEPLDQILNQLIHGIRGEPMQPLK